MDHWGQNLSGPMATTYLQEDIQRCLVLGNTLMLHQYCSSDHTATEGEALMPPPPPPPPQQELLCQYACQGKATCSMLGTGSRWEDPWRPLLLSH